MADSSLEYASLLPVQGEIMPDDELDGVGGHPSLTSNLDDNDEFLPSTSANAISSEKALSKFQDDDEDDQQV